MYKNEGEFSNSEAVEYVNVLSMMCVEKFMICYENNFLIYATLMFPMVKIKVEKENSLTIAHCNIFGLPFYICRKLLNLIPMKFLFSPNEDLINALPTI